MQERNIINGVSAVIMSSLYDFAYPLRWLLLLGAALIVVDLRFGIRASRVRGESVRTSRAIRRTVNKSIDYLCWILIAGALGETFGDSLGVKVLPLLVMLVIYGVEVNSCFSNYFEAKGSIFQVDIFKFFAKNMDIIEVGNSPNKNDRKEGE
ncbi:MAG: hypothetical protein SNH27_09950 [Rikenellaceae bacterium]